jgi:DnaJ-class molecular chaperone
VIAAWWRTARCPQCRGGGGQGTNGYSECEGCAGLGRVVVPVPAEVTP